ncbi:MAG: hypothetical protein Q9Q13_14590 [Acidobacteriota bacterium]|nr:hypothetical protein [Acidobacteriota bacterium]
MPLVLVLVPLAPVLAETSPERELEQIQNIYRAITSYHTLLQGEGVTKEMVDAALYDVEHYVEEIDGRYATDKLFVEDRRILGEITKTVAKAHFQAALLHARGVDLEGSIVQYEKVLDLLGYDPADWDVDIERSGRPGLLSGVSEVVFQMASPREAVEDLKHFWSAGVVTRFRVREFSPGQLEGMTLERIGGRNDAFSQASFELAQERFAERVKAGLEEFRVVLPPGRYRATAKGTGRAAGVLPAAGRRSRPHRAQPQYLLLRFRQRGGALHAGTLSQRFAGQEPGGVAVWNLQGEGAAEL